MASKPQKTVIGGGLVALIGAPAAMLLMRETPRHESRRTVTVEQAQGGLVVQHVSGPQYLKAYLDIVKVPTACDGITKGVKLGQTYTAAQCDQLLASELEAHAKGVMACTPGLALSIKGRDNVRAAMVSLAYNVGVAGYCRSSIPGKINAGRIKAACDTLLSFNKAGGRVARGLTVRREAERAICVRDA